jgi:hypothetical protein
MTTVSRTSSVAPGHTVIPYLADFAHAEEWDPGTEQCVRNGEAPRAAAHMGQHFEDRRVGAPELARL